MKEIDSLFKLIEEGRAGKNQGLSMGIDKLSDALCGIQRSTITVLGGSTGSGKTSLALYSYIYAPLKLHLEDDKYRVVYFSLEMTKEMLEAKLLSTYVYENYDIPIDYNEILSRKEILSDEKYEILLECRPWLEKVRKVLTVYDTSVTPVKIHERLQSYASTYGKFSANDVGDVTYTPNNPYETVMIIIDHLGLVQGSDKKKAADETSAVLMNYRKICRYSALELMQINRGASSMDRRTNNMQEIELNDYKGTGNPIEDSDITIALFNPLREKMTTYNGYPVKTLRDRLRSVLILKSRFGVGETGVFLNFFGEVNLFKSLPKPEEVTNWVPYTILDFKNTPQEGADENSKSVFTFNM